jgi:hypothetical protein
MTTTITTAIGLPPSGTIKLSQAEKARVYYRAMGSLTGVSRRAESVARQKKAAKAGGKAYRQRERSRKAVEAQADECPRRVLLTAALAGDKDARWTAQQLFGDGWRKLAESEVGR